MLLSGASILLSLVLNISTFVLAQNTNATCQPDFQWSFNSLGQSPCVVVSYLRAACKGSHFISALPPDFNYNGPGDPSSSEPCWCSSVVYSLYEACQLCQGSTANMRTWQLWSINCTQSDINNGNFPRDIPAGTAVPAWAYEYTYKPEQTFSDLEAQNYAATNKTEITRSSNNSGASSNPKPTDDPSNQIDDDKKTNTGVIAGGVVGGVVGLALLAGAAFFFLRRRRQLPSRAAPPAAHEARSNHWQPQPQPGVYQALPRNKSGAIRYYDPSDPSTFPTTPSSTQRTMPTYHSQTGYANESRPNRPGNMIGHPYVAEL